MIAELYVLQKKLNDDTNGAGWLGGITKEGNEIDWPRCMRFELTEAIDQSTHWKHWKNIKDKVQYSIIDLHNMKIELVDAGHFLNSEIIKKNLINDIIHINIEETKFTKIEQGKPLIVAIENLIKLIFKYEEENDNYVLLKINDLFWQITFSVMTLKEFYNMYLAKNCLNVFRQKNGYKDGTYIKEWGKDKIEDNVFIEKYFLDNPTKMVQFEELYHYLDSTYKELNK